MDTTKEGVHFSASVWVRVRDEPQKKNKKELPYLHIMMGGTWEAAGGCKRLQAVQLRIKKNQQNGLNQVNKYN